MYLKNELAELVEANVISEETAGAIRLYLSAKERSPKNGLFVVFGILGALLVGLGILLIIAHNWDDFTRTVKTCFAFLPLVTGQLFCVYSLLKKRDNNTWTESSGTFLFFAVGASISLISQIYNIPGDIGSFLLTWAVLCLPLVYLMRSTMVSILYIAAITYYATELGYWEYGENKSYLYWPMLLLGLPHYFELVRKKPYSVFANVLNWVVPLSLIITLGTITEKAEEFMYIAYMSMFGLFYIIGNAGFFNRKERVSGGYKILGSLGIMSVLMILSFDSFWNKLAGKGFKLSGSIISPESLVALLITLLALLILYRRKKIQPVFEIQPEEPVFVIVIAVFFIGMISSITALVLINLLIFTLGIIIIREGVKTDRLVTLNYGLSVIAALIICRFFDTDISFVVRGLLFISVGSGFFIANSWMLKKRNSHA